MRNIERRTHRGREERTLSTVIGRNGRRRSVGSSATIQGETCMGRSGKIKKIGKNSDMKDDYGCGRSGARVVGQKDPVTARFF